MAKLQAKFIWVQAGTGSAHFGTLAVIVTDSANSVIVHLTQRHTVTFVAAADKQSYPNYFKEDEHIHILSHGRICRTVTLQAEGELKNFQDKISAKLKHYDCCDNNCATAAKFALEALFPEHYLNSVQRSCQIACLCGICAICTCGCIRQIPCAPIGDTPADVFALVQMVHSYQMRENKTDTPMIAFPPPEKSAAMDLKKSTPAPPSEQKTPLSSVSLFHATPTPDISFCGSLFRYAAARLGCLT